MMSGVKLDVLWSPVHHDKFILWGPDITLYEVARIKEIEKKTTFVPISSTRGATVVASQSANGVRCVDISAIPDQPEPLVALGYASGRVALTTLKQTYDPLGLVGREFNPKYPRLCNSVSWNHMETNMLAVAMEKYRNDHCILLWDVNRGLGPEESKTGEGTPLKSAQPVAEMGLSETAHSVAWSNVCNATLVASMNLKYIKIFDLRELSNKSVLSTTSRFCYGAAPAPWGGWWVASRGEGTACVWDTRRLDRPLLTLPHPRPLAAMHWCPTRRNLLITLQKESNTLRLHDIQQPAADARPPAADADVLAAAAIEADASEWSRPAGAEGGAGADSGAGAEGGPGVLERDVCAAGGAVLAAFACHPAHQATLLALTADSSIVQYTVCERVTVAWGAGALVWGGGGGGALTTLPPHALAGTNDISCRMRRRAQTDYGHMPDLWQNADLAEDDELSNLWHFLALSKSLVEDGCIRNSGSKFPGVRAVVRGAGEGGYRSEMVPSLLADLPSRRVTLYRSAERTRALQLCGWGWGWDNAGAGVERAEAAGAVCRAAALAAFHLRLRAALDVLARAQEPLLRVGALALAGLSEERLWREAAAAAARALPDAYLRALLHFLAASQPAHAHAAPPPDLSAVLDETDMRLEDRVAFACLYLGDARLHDYVSTLARRLAAEGALGGVLVLGAGADALPLLQRWLDRSGDVQSAALLAARTLDADTLQDPRVQHWLDSYRSLVESWQAWGARCALDTAAGAGAGGARLVSVACSYCGKSVAAAARAGGRGAPRPPPAAKMKQVSSCPVCRKPLARCAVCALQLGTAAAGAPFASWFSWCAACRHGGHAAHLLTWFSEHSECPVSSCNCQCSTLDPPDRL